MAPEQATLRSHRLSPATDIWGLGAVLYELLTGEPPFRGPTPQATLEQVARHTVRSPRRLRPEIPGDMEAICLACLAREPGARYANARALADDLQRFLDHRPVSVRPLNALQRLGAWARRDPRLAAASAAAVLALLLGLMMATVQWQRAEGHAWEARSLLWTQRLQAMAHHLDRRAVTAALPPLVENLAEQEAAGAWGEAATTRLRIGALLQQSPMLVARLTLDNAPNSLLLDPEGRWLAVNGGTGRVQLFDLPGGALRWSTDVRRETDSPMVDAARLLRSADGRHIILDAWHLQELRAPEQFVLRLEDGVPLPHRPAAEGALHQAQYTPDLRVQLQILASGDALRYAVVEVASGRLLAGPAEIPGMAPLLAPDGRSLAMVMSEPGERRTLAGHRLEMYEIEGLRHRWSFAHRPGSRMHWAEFSPDARYLALGFDSGETVLVDATDGSARELRPHAGGAVKPRFSADGNWLAGVAGDGSIRVWDVASRRLLTPPVHFGDGVVPHLISLDSRSGTLLAGSQVVHRLWHLLPSVGATTGALSDRPGAAQLLLEVPRPATAVQSPGVELAPAAGLLASGGTDGEVRLWRLREPEAVLARPPPLALRSEGAILGALALDLSDRRLRLVDSDSGRTVGQALDYVQAPSFVALRPASTQVLAAVGASLQGHDLESGRASFPEVALPASPTAMLLSPDGERLLLVHQARRDPHNLSVLSLHAASDGSLLARREVRGVRHQLRFSRGGGNLLLWRHGDLEVLDTRTLAPRLSRIRFGYDVDALARQAWVEQRMLSQDAPDEPRGTPIREVELGEDDSRVWMVVGIGGDYGYRLNRLDLDSGQVHEVAAVTRWPLAMRALDGGRGVAVLLPTGNELRLYAGDGGHRSVMLPELDNRSSLALSPDGRWLAVGLRSGLLVLDARSGEALTPLMPLPLLRDQLAGLGFRADGRTLHAWSVDGRRWRIALAPEDRPLAFLRDLALTLAPPRASRSEVPPLAPAVLAGMDPGPPRARAVPPRPPDIDFAAVDPRHVDLRPACNLPRGHDVDRMWLGFRLDALLPPGRHRLLDTTFEVRCGLLAEWVPGRAPSVAAGSRLEGVLLPALHARALHILATGATMFRQQEATPYAVLVIGYRDGSEARLPVLWRDHMQAHFFPMFPDEAEARVAWVALGGAAGVPAAAAQPALLFAARIENPHPGRELATLAWESVQRAWSTPLLLGVTLELVDDPPWEDEA
jgi:hypothetical protein